MREYFRFTSPLPPLSRHRAGSRESICAPRKIRGVEREFPIDDGDVIVGPLFHISASYTIPAMREDFYIPQWSTEQEITESSRRDSNRDSPLISSRSSSLNKINIYENVRLLADLAPVFSLFLRSLSFVTVWQALLDCITVMGKLDYNVSYPSIFHL